MGPFKNINFQWLVFSMFNFIYRALFKIKAYAYKLINYKYMKGVVLHGIPHIIYPCRISIGQGTRINEKVFIHAKGGVFIGKSVTLSYGATILTTGYSIENWRSNSVVKDHVDGAVLISDYVWVCANVTVLPGVKIAEGVVVAAGSVVTTNLMAEYCLYGGVPAKKIKEL